MPYCFCHLVHTNLAREISPFGQQCHHWASLVKYTLLLGVPVALISSRCNKIKEEFSWYTQFLFLAATKEIEMMPFITSGLRMKTAQEEHAAEFLLSDSTKLIKELHDLDNRSALNFRLVLWNNCVLWN